jgi:hypothetical protein
MRRILSLLPAAVLAIGCSDSTGPPGLAQHLDALYQQACAGAYNPASGDANSAGYDTLSGSWQRCMLLSVLLAGPASGAEPSPITVTTDSGTSTWQGLVINEYDTNSSGVVERSVFVMIAYSDANVSTALVSSIGNGGSPMYVIAGNNIVTDAWLYKFQVTAQGLGPRCTDVSGLANPLANAMTGYPPIEYGPSVCQLATYQGLATAEFQASPGLNPNLQLISIAPQTINGITVVPAGFYSSRLRLRSKHPT